MSSLNFSEAAKALGIKTASEVTNRLLDALAGHTSAQAARPPGTDEYYGHALGILFGVRSFIETIGAVESLLLDQLEPAGFTRAHYRGVINVGRMIESAAQELDAEQAAAPKDGIPQ
jgi:hypothetical protein